MARILVVDDDPRLIKAVAKLLRQRGHLVESVPTGELAHQTLRRGGIDIVLLDINLPGIDGLSLVHLLREEGNSTPLILLSSRAEAHEQALGLRLGSDDYIAKPFNPEVLLARIQAVLRRSTPATAARTETVRRNLLEIKPIEVDFTARQVFKNGVPVRLAPMEYAVLEFLVANRGRAVSKDELMLHVWGSRRASRTLAEHVSRLRRKLGEELIVTQSGFGYLVPSAPPAGPAADSATRAR
ncbi:response regulator transcription factor [Actinomadura scrupuli]|uniref:response regulator transcription factor n=1 Tax=Actinomadura scrupuli TaxID=559629 RepID=UPI003D9637D8